MLNSQTIAYVVKVDTSQAKKSISQLNTGFSKTTESAESLDNSLGSVKDNIQNSIPGLSKLLSYTKNIKSAITSAISKTKGTVVDTLGGSGGSGKIAAIGTGLKNIVGSIKGVTSAVGQLIKALLPLLTILAAIKAVRTALEVASLGDTINDEAKKVFMSTTAYQEWGYVLEQNGIDLKQLNTLMRKFGKLVVTNTDSLRKYDVTSSNVNIAFEQAIEHIQNITTDSEKLAAATELFGNRAAELMPILKLSNDETKALMKTYRALSGTMDDNLIKIADEVNDRLTEMKAAWQGLKNTLSALFLPTISAVIRNLTILIAKINIVLKAIFGIKEEFGGINADTHQFSEDLDTSYQTAKKLKKTLLGIDELNIMASSEESDTALDSLEDVSVNTDKMFDATLLQELEDFKNKVDDIKSKIEEVCPDWKYAAGLLLICTGHIIPGLMLISMAANGEDTSGIFGKILSDSNNLIPILSIVAGCMLITKGIVPIGLTLLGYGVGSIVANSLFDDTHKGLAALLGIGLTVAGIILLCCGIVPAGLALLGMGLGATISAAKSGGFSQIKDNLYDLFTDIAVKVAEFAIKIGEKWNEMIQGFKDKILAKKEEIAQSWAAAVDAVKTAVRLKAEEIKSNWNAVVQAVTDAFKYKKEQLKNNWNEALNSIKTLITEKGSVLKDIWNRVVDNITTIDWVSIKDKWKNGFKNLINSVIETVEDGINNIVDKIKDSGLGKSKIGEGLLGNLKHISIPRLANGGVIKTPTIAELGEYSGAKQNPEIAAPQSLLRETIDASNADLVTAFAQMTRQVIAAIENKDLEVSIGDDVIAKSAARGNNVYKHLTGKSLITT